MSDDEARLQRAFKAFQDAAQNRDKDPEAFEAARMRYYFLKKGPAWFEQEKQRIAADKLDPVLNEYRDMYTSLETEATVQKAYTDSIEAIRDKQENLKDGATKHVSFLERLLRNEEQQKSAFDRYVELTSPTSAPSPEDVAVEDAPFFVRYFSGFPSSFSIILDVVLGLFILIILWLGIRKTRLGVSSMFSRGYYPTTSSSYFGVPSSVTAPFARSPSFGPIR